MIRLTCNQMMLLLSIYRGTEGSDYRGGWKAHNKDKAVLAQAGYITPAGDELTTAGHERVQRALRAEGEQS